jgi:hypothetical protein
LPFRKCKAVDGTKKEIIYSIYIMNNYYYLHEDNLDFNNMYFMIKIINDNKHNILYKSFIPRLKDTKYRGIQAFKQLLKFILNDNIVLNAENKTTYLNCFKLVFHHSCFAMNINNKKTLLFNLNTKQEKIEEMLKFQNVYYGITAPYNSKINKKDIIKICSEFIINYELDKEDIIELFIELLKKDRCPAQLLNNGF